MTKIITVMTASLKKRLADKDINIEVSDKAMKLIVEKGANKEYGARPLRVKSKARIQTGFTLITSTYFGRLVFQNLRLPLRF